jgi:hypothetical protein
MLNWKYLFTSVVIVGFSFLSYLSYTDNLPSFLDGRLFLSQVTPLGGDDLAYLQDLTPPVQVDSLETLQQLMIETLLDHMNEFDSNSDLAAKSYVLGYFQMNEPPSNIDATIDTAVQKFLQFKAFMPAIASMTITPFLNEVLSVLANHQALPNNHQTIKRQQTGKNLLEALIKQM